MLKKSGSIGLVFIILFSLALITAIFISKPKLTGFFVIQQIIAILQ